MEKIIVTGGAGFIGSHIVDALVELGYEVHIIDNLSAGKMENINAKAIFHNVDIRDKEKLIEIFKDMKYVFHEAAMPQVQYSIENPIETHDINVTGLLNVLEASRLSGVKRVIFAASSAAYGNQDTLPLVETMNAMPLSPYGAHKYIGEVYCKLWADLYGIETVSLRYFNVYGPRQSVDGAYPCVVAKFVDLYKQGKPLTITGDGNQTRSFIHVTDIARANIMAMKIENVGRGEVINIGTDETYSINKIAELIGGEVVYIEKRIEPYATEASILKAKELLDWSPKITLEEGILDLKK
ncbi:MAG: NAD-dependent epimerase/dehydratase family protein [Patescibacteria group bacterium]